MNEFSSLTSSLAVSPPASSNGPHPTAKIPPVLQLLSPPPSTLAHSFPLAIAFLIDFLHFITHFVLITVSFYFICYFLHLIFPFFSSLNKDRLLASCSRLQNCWVFGHLLPFS